MRPYFSHRFNREARSGFALVAVLGVMMLIAFAVSAMAFSITGIHTDRARSTLSRTARVAADSGAAYVQVHADTWRAAPPESVVDLDVSELLAAQMTGAVQVTCQPAETGLTCVVTARIERHGVAMFETRTIVLP